MANKHCVICGNKTCQNNDNFCYIHLQEAKLNKIIQCEKCGEWHYYENSCKCQPKERFMSIFKRSKERKQKALQTELEKEKKNNGNTYIKKTNVLSSAELDFKNKLDKAIDSKKYVINCQTSLRQLVEKVKRWEWANELNRDLDFCILKRDTYEVVLCIEYDDSTHNSPDRIERDRKVDSIAKDAGLKLIHIKRDDNMSIFFLKRKINSYLK